MLLKNSLFRKKILFSLSVTSLLFIFLMILLFYKSNSKIENDASEIGTYKTNLKIKYKQILQIKRAEDFSFDSSGYANGRIFSATDFYNDLMFTVRAIDVNGNTFGDDIALLINIDSSLESTKSPKALTLRAYIKFYVCNKVAEYLLSHKPTKEISRDEKVL